MSQGGGNGWDNVVTACSPCNNRKGNHTPAQAGMPLRSVPGEPNHVHLVWAVRRVTPTQARWIGMFYGGDALALLGGEEVAVPSWDSAAGGWGQGSNQA